MKLRNCVSYYNLLFDERRVKDGFHNLLALVDKGVRVKAAGFGRVELDVEQALRSIISVNPDAFKWYLK